MAHPSSISHSPGFRVGVDSDGTVFDSMEIKHKRVFQPLAVEIWGLEPVGEEFYEIAEKINLYSVHRGVNRFQGLVMAFERLARRTGWAPKNAAVAHLREFVLSGAPPSTEYLEAHNEAKRSKFLDQVIEWSRRCDALYAKITGEEGNPAFPHAKTALEFLKNEAEIMVVSSSARNALLQDWGDAGLLPLASRVAGLLREELGFQGLITSDSITMGALIDRYGIGETCGRALAAGIDTILMKAENQWRGEVFYTLHQWLDAGKIDPAELDEKVRRILRLKVKFGLFDTMGLVDATKAAAPYSDPVVIETARKAAQNAILVAKDDLGAVPLDLEKKILLINQQNSIKSPNDRHDHPALFSQILEEECPSLQTYETRFGSDPAQDEAVLRFVETHDFDLIVCTNYYDRQEVPNTYVRTLIERGHALVLITNTPYCIKETGGLIPSAPTVILNMNLTPEGLRTTRDVLLGRTEARGRWPLRNYHPLESAGERPMADIPLVAEVA